MRLATGVKTQNRLNDWKKNLSEKDEKLKKDFIGLKNFSKQGGKDER